MNTLEIQKVANGYVVLPTTTDRSVIAYNEIYVFNDWTDAQDHIANALGKLKEPRDG